jgi:invasion protein IalB
LSLSVERSPAHAQADIEGVVVGAAADPAVVAQVDLRRLGDGGHGLEADHGGIARRRSAEHGEAVARRAGEGRDRPTGVGELVLPAKTGREAEFALVAEADGASEIGADGGALRVGDLLRDVEVERLGARFTPGLSAADNPRLSGGPKSGLYRVGRIVGSEGMTSMMSKISVRSRLAILGLVLAGATPGLAPPVLAQDTPPSAWRVECTGDGKSLDCRAVQQMINRDDKQLVAQLAARVAPDKSAVLLIQLPLGISLTEPVQLKVDNGTAERYPVQTCTNVGCIVSVPLKDPLMAAMRTGTLLKISIQDTNKRTINIDVPLLGFGLAFDKAK